MIKLGQKKLNNKPGQQGLRLVEPDAKPVSLAPEPLLLQRVKLRRRREKGKGGGNRGRKRDINEVNWG